MMVTESKPEGLPGLRRNAESSAVSLRGPEGELELSLPGRVLVGDVLEVIVLGPDEAVSFREAGNG